MQQGEYLEQKKRKGQEPIKQSCLAIKFLMIVFISL